MKLRDHPMMIYAGANNWPPVWMLAKKESIKKVTGEVGILTYVLSNFKISGKLFLVMDYEGETYVGTLMFKNHAFCKQLGDLLQLHQKKPIKEIGDLEMPLL